MRLPELILDQLSAIGLDRSKIGLHSLRSGGASAAANAGSESLTGSLIKRHGRRQSERANNGYVNLDQVVSEVRALIISTVLFFVPCTSCCLLVLWHYAV